MLAGGFRVQDQTPSRLAPRLLPSARRAWRAILAVLINRLSRCAFFHRFAAPRDRRVGRLLLRSPFRGGEFLAPVQPLFDRGNGASASWGYALGSLSRL